MQALGWNEVRREAERIRWGNGEIAGAAWLDEHVFAPAAWLPWDKEALDARAQLETRAARMD